MTLKVGDRVKLIEGSDFEGQSKNRIGTIHRISPNSYFNYYVKWGNDANAFDYRDEDLILLTIDWRKRLR